MILIIRQPATIEQVEQMKEFDGDFIKLAVDVKREVLAGGGEFHADCEESLLEDGSKQVDVWGADWFFETHIVGFESMINIRPRQQNFSMEVEDSNLRANIEQIVRALFEVES
jgi:hypothetical protein